MKYLKIIIPIAFLFVILLLAGFYFRHNIRSLYLALRSDESAFEFAIGETNKTLLYRLYCPDQVKEDVPLVLYLHSSSQNGEDNLQQMDFIYHTLTSRKVQKEQACYVLAPQCPPNLEWVNKGGSIPYQHYNQDSIKESEELIMITALIAELNKTHSIDMNRIYVTGFSMGATGVWDIITRYPDLFAAAIPISGVSDTSKAHLVTNTAVWAFHGENDYIAPVELNINMVDAIKKAGGNAKLTVLKNTGHTCMKETLAFPGVFNWLFNQSI